jgi:hypothetical protein
MSAINRWLKQRMMLAMTRFILLYNPKPKLQHLRKKP